MDSCNYELNFICLTETWASPTSINYFNLTGFVLGSSYCRNNFKGGGVAIFLKNDLEFKEIDLQSYCLDKHIEICALSWKINKTAKTGVILSCYRSPSGDIDIFFNVLLSILNFIYKPNINILLCGDFNIDSYNNSNDFKKMCNLLQCFNLKSTIGWPTRVTDTSLTGIDQIFSNFTDNATSCVLDNHISDHRTILFDLGLDKIVENSTMCYIKRSFNDNSIYNFQSDIQNENWPELYSMNDVNLAFDYFINIFLFYFNKHFPKRKYYVNNTKNKKWVDNQVKISSIKLKDLHVLKNVYPELKSVYKKEKKKHNMLVKSTKKIYYQNKINNSDNPAKSAWNIVSEMSNKTKQKHNIIIQENDQIINNQTEVANAFNIFFKNAPLDIINKIPDRDNKNTQFSNNIIDQQNTIFLQPYSEPEICNVINNKLKNKHSSGHDDVPSFLIKKVMKEILKPLVFIVNLSFSVGTFPKFLKIGKVIPIHKKENVQDLKNYRPVTIPSGFSKIIEYCFLDRLLNFLNKNNAFSRNQHGFLHNKSTLTAVQSFYKQVVTYVEAGECPIGIFCDLSRAFDCVNHEYLLIKLYKYGVRGISLKWIESYLLNRKQYVSVTNTTYNTNDCANSEALEINMGVPQGSVLAPILFLLYINDLDALNSLAHFTFYADDTSIIISDKNISILETKCNILLKNLSNWFCENSLFLNAEKTQAITFHNIQRKCDYLDLQADNTIISTSALNVKFLGINIDSCLNWKNHCESLVSKLHSIVYQFRNLKHVLNNHQLRNLYFAQVDSRLRYGICFWGVSTLSNDVFLAQKRVLRCMTGLSSRDTCKNMFKECEILTLPSLFIFELCLYVFKNKNKFARNKDLHDVNTRQKHGYYIPFNKLNISIKAPDSLGPRVFNNLPEEIRHCNGLSLFKNRLKIFLIDKTFYKLEEYFNM